MKALVFGTDPAPVETPPETPPEDAPRLLRHLATTPMALQEIDGPELLAPDWLVLRTRLCGICGSDTKQVLMDFDDGAGNPMSSPSTSPPTRRWSSPSPTT